MPVITFTAKRKIATGYNYGDTVQFEIPFMTNNPSIEATKTNLQSEAGFSQTWVDRIADGYGIRTIYIDSLNDIRYPLLKMFASSVAGSEEFEVDFDGTIEAASTNYASFKIPKVPSWTRQSTTNYMSLSFDMVESL